MSDKPITPTLASEAPVLCLICLCSIIIVPITYIGDKIYLGSRFIFRKSKKCYLDSKKRKLEKLEKLKKKNNIINIIDKLE